MNNPTGADNAQVQDDADMKACQIVSHAQDLWTGVGKRISHSSYIILAEQVATALREAEQRGLMRAAEIARAYKSGLPYARDDLGALKEAIDVRSESIAQAIERAAKPEAKE